MLHDLKELIGSSVIAIDGEMGKVRNFLFDDLSWTVLYLVVDVGIWGEHRAVVLPIAAVERPDWEGEGLPSPFDEGATPRQS